MPVPGEQQPPTVEPYDSEPSKPVRWRFFVPALLAALALSMLAPEPWPAGPGSVVLELGAESRATALAQAVEVGTAAPVVVEAQSGSLLLEVSFPAGIPVDAPIEATVAVRAEGEPVQPALDEVRLSLDLTDGRRELIPVIRWDAEDEVLVAGRRPPVDASLVMGLLGFVVVLWVSEAVPLFVTSLTIPIVLAVAGAATATEALAPFFHPIIALFFGGFLMAEAMRRVGLDHLAAISIVARAGRSPASLFAAMLGVSAFLSMWMSNTASTAVLVPIALAVAAPLGIGFRKAAVLGIAYAATIGGVGSAIGTPANPLAIEFLDEFAGTSISFVGWFAYGLPMVFLFLPIMGVYLWRRSDVTVDSGAFVEARQLATAELDRVGRPTGDQLVVLAVFAGVMLLWLTQTIHEINTGIVALMGAVTLAVLGKIRPDDLGRISWASLLTFGGGLTLGLALTESGTSDWLATRLTGLSDLPAFVGIAAVAILALFLTTVASNTATAAMLIPLAIPLAGVLGVDPTLLVIVVAIASSVDFALVIGTPPTMIAYSTELYTAPEIFRKGIVLDLAGVLLLVTVVTWFWSAIGLV